MKVDNSSQVPLKLIRPLIDFVVARTESVATVRILVRDGNPQKMTGGHATQYHPSPELHDTVRPSLVELWVRSPESSQYPFREQFLEELEPVTVASWEEEVLLVLAHELRHIDQFWDPEWDQDAHIGELDAEAFAIQTLAEWRAASQRQPGRKAMQRAA